MGKRPASSGGYGVGAVGKPKWHKLIHTTLAQVRLSDSNTIFCCGGLFLESLALRISCRPSSPRSLAASTASLTSLRPQSQIACPELNSTEGR